MVLKRAYLFKWKASSSVPDFLRDIEVHGLSAGSANCNYLKSAKFEDTITRPK
jgi:hypothetical protein